MNVGLMLKYYRMLYRMTQSEAAELSGINEKYLGRIERNESVPTIDKVEQLCMAFDIRVSDLLTPVGMQEITLNCNEDEESTIKHKKVVYYCNCCGEEFTSETQNIICPNCQCEYDEENGFIETYTTIA